MNANQTNTGKVKFYNITKGYGFIIIENTEKEIFFHVTGISKDSSTTLEAESKVSFEIIEEKRGLKAINVTLL